ncbi:protein YgfX [Agarivorans sp. Toyoura001]|uniref:protein YgfX n=1 Tax=unclassified Agarivorans TaxID=2636026 RepID=UPI0010F4DB41|nr:protein YgfX [Agarivorans sp. Toyoura001]
MLFSSASKCEFSAARSRCYFYLVFANGLLQVTLLLAFPELMPLFALCLLATSCFFYHWWHYQPSGYFSAEQIVYQQGEHHVKHLWLANSRVAFGACLVVSSTQDKPTIKVIFADSLPNDVYRQLCFVINFPQA